MDVLGVLVAEQIIESLHAGRPQYAVQHDVLEHGVQLGAQATQVRGGARAQHVATRTLLDEFDFAGLDAGGAGGLSRRLRERSFIARRRRRYLAAAELEDDQAI